MNSPEIKQKKAKSREIFKKSFEQQYENYKELSDLWELDTTSSFGIKKKITSCIRRIIGMGVSTGGVWTGNVRALRHVLAMRCSEHAEEEICHVFTRICEYLVEKEPLLFGDFEKVDGFFQPKYKKV